MSDSTEKPRGLWNLMSQRSGEEEQSDSKPDDTTDATSAETESTPTDSEAAPKGLWSVMKQPVDSTDDNLHQATPPVDGEPSANDTADQPAPRGLWGVMSATSPPASPDVSGDTSSVESTRGVASESITGSNPDADDGHSAVGVPVDVPPGEPGELNVYVSTAEKPAYQRLPSKSGRSQKALVACLAGLCATPLAALALLPEAWLRLPATAVGFVALMLGLLGWQDIRASRGRQTGIELALAGVVLGVLAMFLGPIVFARIGQGYRSSFGRQQTITNLETIGDGLLAYHSEHERFPAGGIFRPLQDGNQQALHGWMTTLLPYIGEEDLHDSIQFDISFDAPANRAAMQQTVESYLAAGAGRDGIGRHKLAPSHFAGVGGELHIEGVGLVRAGIFGRNSDTTREDITDGLSQTFVAGQISAFYPAWGEPENWRMIGRGLNRDSAGFGNAAGTGALFLRADGSVKFYTNETDSTLLRQLSTPAAGDIVSQ